MNEDERIATEPCGCRVDKVTGVLTHFCAEHDPDGKKEKLAKFAKACRKNAGLED